MTMNFNESIRKMMGWCPNASALAAKRVMVALPEGEDFFADDKGRIDSNPVKLKWGNKYRNLMLVSAILILTVYSFPILLLGRDYAEDMTKTILKINLFSIIFAVFILYTQWRDLNRINKEKLRPAKTEIVLGALLLMLLLLSGAISIYSAIMGITIYLVEILLRVFLMAFVICVPFMYPMVIYWEWKNKKTIYLVEKESRGWRPVALPDRVS